MKPKRGVDHGVGNPVGALVDAEVQPRDVLEVAHCHVERHRPEIERNQAAVDDEQQVREPSEGQTAPAGHGRDV
jgi:hypothetical protein